MTRQLDILAVIKGLGDLDDKLFSHAGVQHIPSILDSDELPEALIYDGTTHFLVATDRRVQRTGESSRGEEAGPGSGSP